MSYVRNAVKRVAGLIPGIPDFYRSVRDLLTARREVAFRPALGFKFAGPAEMERGEFEPVETAMLAAAIGSCDLLVNIGANTGYYVLRALSHGVPVVAFEPNELNVQVLMRNLDANHFSAACLIFPVALGHRPGILPLYGGSTGGSLVPGWAGQTKHRLVPVLPFDSFAYPVVSGRRCFVLIDIEGAELDCLKGATTLFSEAKDLIFMVEISVSDHQPRGRTVNPNLLETFQFFFARGFAAYTVELSPREIVAEEVQRVQSGADDSLRCCNFLFIPVGRQLADCGIPAVVERARHQG